MRQSSIVAQMLAAVLSAISCADGAVRRETPGGRTFDAIDADKDGVVTPAEMQAYQQRQRAAQPPPPAKR